MDRERRAVRLAARGEIMACRVRVRAISNQEGNRLLRIVRRSSGSVVAWRRAQMVLLSAQGMDSARIAEVTFTSADRVRDVIHNFNADGFDALFPRYRGGRPPTLTLPERQQIKRIALSRPTDHDLPFSTWSLAKLADFLVAEGVVEDISHEGLRALLRDEGVSFQRLKTFKESNDPDFEAKQQRVLELYAIADGHAERGPDDPEVVICLDEFGPLNLQPHPGSQWTRRADCHGQRRRRRRATYTRPHGVRHLLAAYDLSRDRLYGHIKQRKGRAEFLAFCRYIRSRYPPQVRLALVLDNFSPHLTTKTDRRVGDWALDNNVELAYVPFYASWLNRIEAQFTGLRYFALDGTDHPDHAAQSRMIRRYIAWRNRNTHDRHLRRLVDRANVA
jgi:transposase